MFTTKNRILKLSRYNDLEIIIPLRVVSDDMRDNSLYNWTLANDNTFYHDIDCACMIYRKTNDDYNVHIIEPLSKIRERQSGATLSIFNHPIIID